MRHLEMTLRVAAILLLLLPIGSFSEAGPGSGVPTERAAALIISNVNLLTLTEAGVLENWHLLIRDGSVAEMAATRPPHWPDSAETVDGTGRFLLPALYDLHVHIFDERDLEVYALMGVTTLRNMDGWDWHLDLSRSDRQSGFPRARMITTGAQYQPPLVTTAEEVASRVERDAESGYTWVKAYDGLSLDQLGALALASSSHGLRVTGHLPDTISAEDALATRAFADVAHAEELLEWYRALGETEGNDDYPLELHLDRLADAFKKTGTALVTTLVNNRMIMEQMADFDANIAREEVGLAAPMVQVFWRSPYNHNSGSFDSAAIERQRLNLASLQRLTAGLHERGVTVLAGTDSPNPTTVPAVSLQTELELLVEAGLTPEAAIRSATVDAADHLGIPKSGRIQTGVRADFVLLDANPFEDVSSLRRQAGVIVGGRFLSGAEIAARLEHLRDVYSSEAALLQAFDPASPSTILEKLVDQSAGSTPALSAEALTSLTWVYSKFGNRDAAKAVALRLAELYPGERSGRVLASALIAPEH